MDTSYPPVRSLVKRLGRTFGIELSRYIPGGSPTAILGKLFELNNVDLVLDVGANTGQFARHAREAGYIGRIISFEPLPDAHAELQRWSESDSLWMVAPRMAIGNHDGEAHINVSRNSVSSSIPANARFASQGSARVRLHRVRRGQGRKTGYCLSRLHWSLQIAVSQS